MSNQFLSQFCNLIPEIILLVSSLCFITFKPLLTNRKPFLIAVAISVLAIALFSEFQFIDANRFALFNNSLVANQLTQFSKVVIFIINILVLSCFYSNNHSDFLAKETIFFLLMSSFAMCILVGANNLLIFYLAIELLSFCLYALVTSSIYKNYKSMEAGFKYFALGAISTSFFLLGFSFIYGATGEINFENIKLALENRLHMHHGMFQTLSLTGLVLIATSIFFKLTLFPFHNWAPDVYEGSSNNIVMLIATSVKFAVFIIAIRLFYSSFYPIKEQFQHILMLIGIASIIFGNIYMITQSNMVRFIAYSGIGNFGFIVLGLSIYDINKFESVLFFVIFYIIFTITFISLLKILGKINGMKESITLDDFNGLFQQSPFLAISFTILLFSIIGIPPLLGFFAKFYIFAELIKTGFYYPSIIAILGMVIGIFFYLNIIRRIYLSNKIVHRIQIPINYFEYSLIILGIFLNILYFVMSDVLNFLRSMLLGYE